MNLFACIPTLGIRLYDGVRVLSRAIGNVERMPQAGAVVAQEPSTPVVQQARDSMKRSMEVARQRGEAAAERLKTTDRALLDVATPVVPRARPVQEVMATQTTAASQRIAKTFASCLPRVEPVITQTTRRGVQGAQVPASEKIVRLCEPETAILRQGQPGKPTAFGRVLWLAEVEGGLLSWYAVLDGHPDETAQVPPRLDYHRQHFGHPPDLLPGDRGLPSAANEQYATPQGATEVVRPTPGKKSAKRLGHERQAWFRAGRNWRAGLEGRLI